MLFAIRSVFASLENFVNRFCVNRNLKLLIYRRQENIAVIPLVLLIISPVRLARLAQLDLVLPADHVDLFHAFRQINIHSASRVVHVAHVVHVDLVVLVVLVALVAPVAREVFLVFLQIVALAA